MKWSYLGCMLKVQLTVFDDTLALMYEKKRRSKDVFKCYVLSSGKGSVAMKSDLEDGQMGRYKKFSFGNVKFEILKV